MTENARQFERASCVIPGGLMSNFRKEEGFVPKYMTHGRGARLYDVDGLEYIDYSLGYGPAILGHSNSFLQQALVDQSRRLYTATVNTLEAEAAQQVVDLVPSAEQVRFVCSGTEAVYNALRLARSHTGRPEIVRFNGHYHGGTDDIMGGVVQRTGVATPVAGESPDDFYSQMTNTLGRATHAFADQLLIEWNDLESLDHLFTIRGDQIAGVIMEPVMINCSGCLPRPGYLEGVRRLCDRHGVVLIFDEVITGFRMGLGGAQAAFGVTPDLTTLGKALGGGFPVAAFCGRKEIMDHITRTDVIAGGTYNGHPLSMAAVVATLQELRRDDGAAMRRIELMGQRLGDGLARLFHESEAELIIQGFPGAWTLAAAPTGSRIDNHAESVATAPMDAVLAFSAALNRQRILIQTRFCTSSAHGVEEVDRTLECAAAALEEMAEVHS
jgi:glutamate-1-semialdehyde 2,1-aminomutase